MVVFLIVPNTKLRPVSMGFSNCYRPFLMGGLNLRLLIKYRK